MDQLLKQYADKFAETGNPFYQAAELAIARFAAAPQAPYYTPHKYQWLERLI
jgi:hypothetical protein